ncbi:hypothetical protein F5888DRAFT_1752248, partial [Russula emetica]
MSCITSKTLGALELAAFFVTFGPSLTSTSTVLTWPGGHSSHEVVGHQCLPIHLWSSTSIAVLLAVSRADLFSPASSVGSASDGSVDEDA